ncbi:MAG: DUF29 domain-containing protein [Gloeocapsa sp. DLM2.Bin57]|nr:MAG: DUF29 domain-containing protein [Gloeocapsa sp. DLM2.Bin57]
MKISTDLKTLYETDDSLWLEATIQLLKNKQFEALDLDNLIEELEDLGNEKKRRVESLLEQLIRHLLLLEYWQEEREYNQAHWSSEIVNFQNQLKRYLTTNLVNHLQECLPEIYADAVRYCDQKTQGMVNFPNKCPYSLDDLLVK